MTKVKFALLVIAGVISCVFSVLAPIHELGHIIAAFLSGVSATMNWATTNIVLSEVTLFIGYAGMFTEITVFTILFFLAIKYKHYNTAIYLFGYVSSYTIIIASYKSFVPLDLQVMLENYSSDIVYIVFFFFSVYFLFAMSIMMTTIYYNKTAIFERKISKTAQKMIDNINLRQKGVDFRGIGDRPLTLVK